MSNEPTINKERFATFAEAYRRHLSIVVAKHPDEYPWRAEKAPVVADRMLAAVRRRSFTKDGRAFVAVCRELGIKHTYKAIYAYLAGE